MVDSPPSPNRSQPAGLPTPRRYWAAIIQLSSIMMSVLDSSIANVALPTIASALDADPANAVWIINAYNIVLLIALLPLAALGERIGFRKVFVGGIAIFTVASLACALSTTLPMLIAGRLLLGVGSAAMTAVMAGMMRHIYPFPILGRGIGLNAMIVGTGGALGPTISSLILAVADWPWLFAINVPIGLLAMAGYRLLPESQPVKARFDTLNAVISAIMLTLLVIGLVELVSHTTYALIALAIGLVLAGLVYRRARGQTAPLWPVDLFPIRSFSFGISSWLFMFAANTATFVAMPFYFLQVFGRDQVALGMLMTAWPLSSVLIAPLAGRLADRYPAARLCTLGASLLVLGQIAFLLLPAHSGTAPILATLVVCGIGFGLFHSPNNRDMLGSVPIHRVGAAGGLQSTTRTFGQSVGAALAAVAFGLSTHSGPTLALILAIVCTLVVIVINLKRWRDSSPTAV